MKRIAILCLSVLALLSCVGCALDTQNEKLTYEINAVADDDFFSGQVTCPELVGDSAFTEPINLLIRQSVSDQLGEIHEDGSPDAILDVGYSVPFQSEESICILFEGTLNDKDAAHPSSIAFSVSISLTEKKLIDLATLFEMDETFLQAFREQLAAQTDQERFGQDEWEAVASYIESYSDEEIVSILRAAPQKTLAVQDNGVIVLFPVSHAIGDYVKIIVPYPLGDASNT